MHLHIIDLLTTLQYSYYDSRLQRTVNQAIALINVVDTVSIYILCDSQPMILTHCCFSFQLYKQVNIRVVGIRAETWTNGDLYTGFNVLSAVTVERFRTYVTANVHETFDAAFLIT